MLIRDLRAGEENDPGALSFGAVHALAARHYAAARWLGGTEIGSQG
ncbi:hypothetical protein ACFDR9_000349 [Janthinobacterium sp. CG_23.3]